MTKIVKKIPVVAYLTLLVLLAISATPASALPAYQADTRPWKAQWIGPSDNLSTNQNTWMCFRKQFTLTEPPATAMARIAADSRYWLWVNGQLVVREGQLKRGPTPNDTSFDELDLAPHLKKGDNTIAILVWFWGKEGFSYKSSGKGALLFEMNAKKIVASDASWKMKLHPAFKDAGKPETNYRLPEPNIRFDARLDLGPWTAPEFNDAAWDNSTEFGKAPCAPWNALWPRSIPFWKDQGLKDYVQVTTTNRTNGVLVSAKLPHNAHVNPWFKIEAPAGKKIDIRMDSSALFQDPGIAIIRAEYITRDGAQEFECPEWMSGHEVQYTLPEGVKVLDLKYRQTGYNTEFTGSFSCDDPFCTRLWTKAQRTLYVTMRDTYMDCPDRERGQWWGDAVNELGEVFYALSPSAHQLTRKAIHDLCLWQKPDKTLFSPCPSGNYVVELPPQMLASVGKYGFWTYYQNTGDRKTLADAYPHVKDYLSVWQLDTNNLVIHRKGGWDWADWGDNIDATVLDNLWYCLAMEGAANMAKAQGLKKDAAAYESNRQAVIQSVNKFLWNGLEYRSPGYKGLTDDRANGLAVVAGAAGPEKYAAIKNVLAREYHASPYMEKYVLEALWLMDDPDAALARTRKRYGEMVNGPLTTLYEQWVLVDGTYNHGWSGGPLTLLSQYAAGIAPLTTAFERYQIAPQMGPLKHIDCTVDSVKGKIQLALSREESRFTMELTSPAKTTAIVCIPKNIGAITEVRANNTVIWKQGAAISKAMKGVKFVNEDSRYLRFSIAPGQWKLEATK